MREMGITLVKKLFKGLKEELGFFNGPFLHKNLSNPLWRVVKKNVGMLRIDEGRTQRMSKLCQSNF